MTTLPHDLNDLFLPHLALELDTRLDEFSSARAEELDYEVALRADRQPKTLEDRRTLALRGVTRNLELRGWEASWSPRGLRLERGRNCLTLGVPPQLATYLNLAELEPLS